MCLTCATKASSDHPESMGTFGWAANNNEGSSDENRNNNQHPQFDPVYLNGASTAIARKWYIFGKSGKKRAPISVSDDEEEGRNMEWSKKPVNLNAASTAMMRKWFTSSRSRIKIKSAGKPKKREEPVKPVRKKPKGGKNSKKSRAKRK